MSRVALRTSLGIALTLVVALVRSVPVPGGLTPPAAGDDGIKVSAEVLDTTPSPSAPDSVTITSTSRPPSSSTSPTRTAPTSTRTAPSGNQDDNSNDNQNGNQNNNQNATKSATTGPSGPMSTATNPTGDADDLKGYLHVSGISATYVPALNPLGGSLICSLMVRNLSAQTVTASIVFWVTNAVGGTIGTPVSIQVADLKGDESRTVTATVDGIGMWLVVGVHATFTPPPLIGDVALTAVTREAVVFAPSWLVLLLLVAAAAAVIIHRSRRRKPGGVPARTRGRA